MTELHTHARAGELHTHVAILREKDCQMRLSVYAKPFRLIVKQRYFTSKQRERSVEA